MSTDRIATSRAVNDWLAQWTNGFDRFWFTSASTNSAGTDSPACRHDRVLHARRLDVGVGDIFQPGWPAAGRVPSTTVR